MGERPTGGLQTRTHQFDSGLRLVRAKWKKVFAWVLLIGSLIGWPVSMVLSSEPPFILSLSWLAIILTAIDGLWVAEESRKNEDRD